VEDAEDGDATGLEVIDYHIARPAERRDQSTDVW
jgi:hypothetical protein